MIIPLILLWSPDQRGLSWVLLLTGVVFVEWPLADALHSQALLTVAIVARAALLIVAALLMQEKTSEGVRPSEV